MNKKLERLLKVLQSHDPESYLATDENYEIIDISDDPYLERIILEGEYFTPKDTMLCDKPLGTCNKSVCEILKEESEEDDILYTGLAKNSINDEWFVHSFIINKGIVVEPGPIAFSAYFGIPLVGNELEEFMTVWL